MQRYHLYLLQTIGHSDFLKNTVSAKIDELQAKNGAIQNSLDRLDEEFKKYVNEKGYDVFSISAATNQGVQEILSEALNKLNSITEEPEEDI